MKEKKPDDYKVSWGSWTATAEILVHVALALCVVYALYSFFHREERKSDTVEKAKAETGDKQDQA